VIYAQWESVQAAWKQTLPPVKKLVKWNQQEWALLKYQLDQQVLWYPEAWVAQALRQHKY
jgi:hypothetical protein